MGAVELHHVETQALGVSGGARKGGHGVGNVLLAHRLAAGLAGGDKAGGALDRVAGVPVRLADCRTGVPDLRPHAATGGVDGINHQFPAGKRFLTEEGRNVGMIARHGPLNDRALRQNETDIAGSALGIIVGIVAARDAIGRESAGHGGHDDTVLQLQRAKAEGTKEGVIRGGVSCGDSIVRAA